MPWVDDLIDCLGDAKFITTLDLSRGYWQVLVREEDQEKTVFFTPYDLLQLGLLPFRLQGALVTFKCTMNVLSDVGEFAAAYLDDVIIYSQTWANHVYQVGEILGKAGLTVKPKKCQFTMSCGSYLGHVVGNGEVRPEQLKVQAVNEFPVPKRKKQVCAFLRLMGYYRIFISKYPVTVAPLTDMTAKGRTK